MSDEHLKSGAPFIPLSGVQRLIWSISIPRNLPYFCLSIEALWLCLIILSAFSALTIPVAAALGWKGADLVDHDITIPRSMPPWPKSGLIHLVWVVSLFGLPFWAEPAAWIPRATRTNTSGSTFFPSLSYHTLVSDIWWYATSFLLKVSTDDSDAILPINVPLFLAFRIVRQAARARGSVFFLSRRLPWIARAGLEWVFELSTVCSVCRYTCFIFRRIFIMIKIRFWNLHSVFGISSPFALNVSLRLARS